MYLLRKGFFIPLLISAFLFVAIPSYAEGIWQKVSNTPILSTGSPADWDGSTVTKPTVIFKDNVYKMWYGGNDGIGYATSADGIHWTKYENNPVLTKDPADPQEIVVGEPDVIYDNNIYKMWYTSVLPYKGSGQPVFRIKYTTSLDGIHWSLSTIALTGAANTWESEGVLTADVLRDTNGYKLYYTARDGGGNLNIGLALSQDGNLWQKYSNNPVVRADKPWDYTHVGAPTVLNENNSYILIYQTGPIVPTSIVYATSIDGIHWEKPTDNPILTRTLGTFDQQYIASPFVIHVGNQYKMYYSGFDGSKWQIGLATKNIGIDLPVPLLKQYDLPWGSKVYDSADKWTIDNPYIANWGCALTSADMVLRYYNIDTMPDGTALTPDVINTWLLKQKDGYVGNGWLNWLAISRLSRYAAESGRNSNFAYDALEFTRINTADSTTLLADLQNNQPDILEEPGHFIVAKGHSGNDYTINDPYYDRATLQAYGNSFLTLNRFTPSHTDLSYILLTTDPSVSLMVKNNTGQIIAQSYIQQPIQDPYNPSHTNGEETFLYFQKPASGNYTITASSNSQKVYSLQEFLYDASGNVQTNTIDGFIDTKSPSQITLSFNSQDITKDASSKVVTIQSFLQDITDANNMHLLKVGAYISLWNVAKTLPQQNKILSKFITPMKLNTLNLLLRAEKINIDPVAYQILTSDIQYLLDHI